MRMRSWFTPRLFHRIPRGLTAVLLLLAAMPAPSMRAAGQGEAGRAFPVEILLRDRKTDVDALVALGIDIDGVFRDRARAYVLQEEVEKLLSLGFDVAPIPDEALLAAEREEREGGASGLIPPTYHTYATLTSELQAIAAAHPDLTRLESLGLSVQGRDLWMMKITKNPDIEEDEPEVRYIAAMHGDEVVGKELCIGLINHLVDNYGIDPRITELIDTTEIWILPSMNPDGTELHQRYNARGFDLNRNFPDQFDDPVDSTAGRQLETQHVMNWGYAHSVNLSANYHGGALVANYPYDGTASGSSVYNASPDDALFVSLSRTYADNNPPMSTSNSDSSWNNGICNGSDWYVIYGGMQDWNYVWHGGYEITLEVGTSKWPPASQLPTFWDQNLESMLAYFERVHEGVRGIVTDATTGLPLAASIDVVGISQTTYTDPDVGDYHRMLLPGNYSLEVSATGYSTSVLDDVVVAAGAPATVRDVALLPLAVDLQHSAESVLDGASGNGALDGGEAVDLAVTLRDLGLAATSISSTLLPTGWFADVTRPDASYPDLPAGGSGQSFAPHYGVEISPLIPAGHKVGFAVQWNSDQGSGTTEPFFVPAGAPTCSTVASTDLPKSILSRATATSTLSFAADSEIAEINVYVNLTHTYIGDLTVTLVSPSGTPVNLHNRTGGSTDNIVGWYDADRTPAEPLSRFDGEHATGTWTLAVTDGVPSNTGTLNSWSLEVCGRPFESSTPEMRLRQVAKEPGKVILEWWPYPGVTSYKIYRAADPKDVSNFVDVTSEDGDPTDTVFEDATSQPVAYYLVTGVGPNGEGPKGYTGE